MVQSNRIWEINSKKPHNLHKSLSKITNKKMDRKINPWQSRNLRMFRLETTRCHLINTLIQSTLAALLVMTRYLNGIVSYAEFTGLAGDLIFFTRLIQRKVFIRIKRLLKRHWYKASAQMEKLVSFTMHMIIIFALLAMRSFQKNRRIHLEPST